MNVLTTAQKNLSSNPTKNDRAVTGVLAKNGYPRTLADNFIRGFFNSKHTNTKTTNQITTQPTQSI